jgi:hypothetical protein
MNDHKKAPPPQAIESEKEAPRMCTGNRARRLEYERKRREVAERWYNFEFSPEDEAILDKLGI